jgi:catechol 2,3-dioxygenase-like lactoylglutathione lyase family enzyme
MTIDHVAVPAKDIAASVAYYVGRFGAEVLYQDATWAFLKFGNTKLALVTPGQHPPHVALSVSLDALQKAAVEAGKKIDVHRDGTQGIYVDDPSGNAVELIYYPPGATHYAARATSGRGPQNAQ